MDERLLRRCFELARAARRRGDHPFGALIVDDAGAVLAEGMNSVNSRPDATGHAELNVVRATSQRLGADALQGLTLYTSTEPCAMCAGAIYWAGISRVVFGLAEARLYDLTGAHPTNPTLRLPCRDLFARGHRVVEVLGPQLEDEALAVHEGFWSTL